MRGGGWAREVASTYSARCPEVFEIGDGQGLGGLRRRTGAARVLDTAWTQYGDARGRGGAGGVASAPCYGRDASCDLRRATPVLLWMCCRALRTPVLRRPAYVSTSVAPLRFVGVASAWSSVQEGEGGRTTTLSTPGSLPEEAPGRRACAHTPQPGCLTPVGRHQLS